MTVGDLYIDYSKHRVTRETLALLVDLGRADARVGSLAEVQSVDVTRTWPDGVRIEVVERTAVAVVELAGRIRGLDADGVVQGWAQYGSPRELSGIKNRREYLKDAPPAPDWRITCVYVDPKHRGLGVARAGIEGALDAIARHGGGRVEAIPEVTAGREAQGRFLFSGTVELFESLGFARVRQVGKHAWIVARSLEAG